MTAHPDDNVPAAAVPVAVVGDLVGLGVVHAGEITAQISDHGEPRILRHGIKSSLTTIASSRPATVKATISEVRTSLSQTTYPLACDPSVPQGSFGT
jgi:hypothetical protein